MKGWASSSLLRLILGFFGCSLVSFWILLRLGFSILLFCVDSFELEGVILCLGFDSFEPEGAEFSSVSKWALKRKYRKG